MDQTRLAVIMACHNRRDNTLVCLSALKNQKLSRNLAIEVFLLDDGSTDGTAEAVSREFPDVHMITGDGTLFWNRGMHRSFSVAIKREFDYYMWLNDDSVLHKNALEVLLMTSQEVASVGARLAGGV